MILQKEMQEKIKNCFNKNYLFKAKIDEFLKNNLNIQLACNQLLKQRPQWGSIINIFYGVLHDLNLIKCKTCYKYIKFTRRPKTYCNNFCRNHDKQLILASVQKGKQTCLKKYGVDNPHKCQAVITKTKETCLKKFNVDNPAKAQSIQNKIKNTNKLKYGCENVFQSQLIKEKSRQTCLKHFGVDHPLKSAEIKEKTENTNMKKYGVKSTLQAKETKQLCQQTVLKKFNATNVFSNKSSIKLEIQDKIKEKYGFKNIKLLYGWNTILSWKDYLIPLFKKQQYVGQHHEYLWKCIRCGNVFKSKIYSSRFLEQFQNIPRCLKCFPKNGGTSAPQQQLINFCKQYFPKLLPHNTELFFPFNVDIVINEINLVIEFNRKLLAQD